MKETNTPLCTLMIWHVPREIKNRFKKACEKQGLTMKKVVIDFLKNYGEEHGD